MMIETNTNVTVLMFQGQANQRRVWELWYLLH